MNSLTFQTYYQFIPDIIKMAAEEEIEIEIDYHSRLPWQEWDETELQYSNNLNVIQITDPDYQKVLFSDLYKFLADKNVSLDPPPTILYGSSRYLWIDFLDRTDNTIVRQLRNKRDYHNTDLQDFFNDYLQIDPLFIIHHASSISPVH